jgi:hypothetical protein
MPSLPLLMMRDTIGLFVLLILNHSIIVYVEACLASFFESISDELYYAPSFPHPVGNVLMLDYLNINHERGRDDWFKGFYFDFLGCVVDPRTADNLNNKGQKRHCGPTWVVPSRFIFRGSGCTSTGRMCHSSVSKLEWTARKVSDGKGIVKRQQNLLFLNKIRNAFKSGGHSQEETLPKDWV